MTSYRSLFRITLPVMMGYLPLGAAFGILLVKAGYPWYLAPLMSVLMYAGSGQFLAVTLFSAGAGIPEAAAATLFVQLRHSFYGLSLLGKIDGFSPRKLYTIFALTDETYALLTSEEHHDGERGEKRFFRIALLNHGYWIAGGTIGALAGSVIPADMRGIDFTLTALFIVLTLDKLRKERAWIPVCIGAAAAAAGVLFFRQENMLLASLAIALSILIFITGAVHENRND